MKKASLVLATLLVSWTSLKAEAALPPGYCQVGCLGTTTVSPFDFAKKAATSGDPNGGPLKATTMIPADEGQSPSKTMATNDLLGNLKSVESWSAGQCGKSLNDDSWSTIQVVAPCGNNAILDRMAAVIKGKHTANGVAIPTKQVGDAFYKAASSDAAQKNLDEQWYCRFYGGATGNADTSLNSNDCKPYEMTLGSTNTVAVGMVAKSCRSVQAPAFKPEFSQTFGSGILGCRKGMPDGSKTTSSEEVTFGAWVLGKSLPLLKTESSQLAPIRSNVTHSSKNYFMGSSLCAKSTNTTKNVSYDEVCPAYKVHDGVKATFAVGPIPITVEAGGEGQLNLTHFVRVAPMWANGRATPGINITGYASAYVDLFIAKGGVEAFLTILKNDFEVYGFSGTAYLPKDTNRDAGFYYSYQLTGVDKINALSGNINAFAKIPVPKFIGWKWKKYVYTIFSWAGLSATGYVYNDMQGPLNIATVK